VIESFGSLFQYFQSTLAYIVPPVVAVYLGGLFWPRFAAAGAFWAIVVGVGAGVALFVAQQVTDAWEAAGLPPIHFTYMALVMFALAFAVMGAVSLFAPAPPAAVSVAVFHRRDVLPEPRARALPWYRDYRVLAAGLAALMLAFIVGFV
jgi:SSS family solute:Na+ symporter